MTEMEELICDERGSLVAFYRKVFLKMIWGLPLFLFVQKGFSQSAPNYKFFICPGDTVYIQIDTTLQNVPVQSYNWYRNDSFILTSSQARLAIVDTGSYYATSESLAGCTSTSSNLIEVFWKPLKAMDDEFYTDPNQVVALAFEDNDSIFCAHVDSVKINLVRHPDHGDLFPSTAPAGFTYRPRDGFVGTDTLTYFLSDDEHGRFSDIATVLIHVGHVITGHQGEPIVVYPNPANDFIYIKGDPDQIEEITLIDERGRVKLRKVIPRSQTSALDVRALASALYYVRIVFKDKDQKSEYFKVLKAQ